MVLKIKRFSHLSDRSFGLGYSIKLETLSLVLSLRAGTLQERNTWERATRCPKGGSEVNAIQSVSHSE